VGAGGGDVTEIVLTVDIIKKTGRKDSSVATEFSEENPRKSGGNINRSRERDPQIE